MIRRVWPWEHSDSEFLRSGKPEAGHQIVLALADLEHAALATHVGGEVLSAGHGYPLRLVAPNLRGYRWVKWVQRIDAS